MNRLVCVTLIFVLLIAILISGCALSQAPAISTVPSQSDNGGDWLDQFDLSSCNMATTGKNQYFVLEPGFP